MEKKGLLESYREKTFTDHKEKIAWLESAVFTVESEMIKLSTRSKEYAKAVKEHNYLQQELITYSPDYCRMSGGWDYNKN